MPDQLEIRPTPLIIGKKGLFNVKKLIFKLSIFQKLIWHELCLIMFNGKKRQNLVARFMKNISLDKYLIQKFREKAEKVAGYFSPGWEMDIFSEKTKTSLNYFN